MVSGERKAIPFAAYPSLSRSLFTAHR